MYDLISNDFMKKTEIYIYNICFFQNKLEKAKTQKNIDLRRKFFLECYN